MRCDEVARILPEAVDNGAAVELSVQRHIDTCLRCQAELARYRRMLRGLQLLRTRYLEPAPGLLAQTLVRNRIQAHAGASWTNLAHNAFSLRLSRNVSRCSSGKDLKNLVIENSSVSGSPLSRFAPARKSAQIISRQ